MFVALGATIISGTAGEALNHKIKFEELTTDHQEFSQGQVIESVPTQNESIINVANCMSEVVDKLVDMDEKKKKMNERVKEAGKKIKVQ